MKNLDKNQIKSSVVVNVEDFERDLKIATGENIEPQFDMDGLWYDYSSNFEDKAEKAGFDNPEDYIVDCLSKYYDIDITSIHLDDFDLTGVWITFKNRENILSIDTPEGTLTAGYLLDPDYPGLYIDLQPLKSGHSININVVEFSQEEGLRSLTWGDANQEDYTHAEKIENISLARDNIYNVEYEDDLDFDR